MGETRWLSAKTLSEYLGMSSTTIKKLEERGLLPKPTGPTPRLLRYDRFEVDNAMRNALAANVGGAQFSVGSIDDAVRRVADDIAKGRAPRSKAPGRRN